MFNMARKSGGVRFRPYHTYMAGCILTVDGFRTFGAAMGVKTPIPPLAKGRFLHGVD